MTKTNGGAVRKGESVNGEIPTWVPVVCFVLGIFLVLHAAFTVTMSGVGRFRGEPFITLTAGFGLLFLGQYLLAR